MIPKPRKATFKPYNGEPTQVSFHCFTTEPIQENCDYNTGGWVWVQYPCAIVEFADGHVETVPASSITFTEAPMILFIGKIKHIDRLLILRRFAAMMARRVN